MISTPHRSPLRTPAVLLSLAALLLAALALPVAAPAASPPAVQGRDGAVVSADHTATAVGLATLAAGGNAVDAAVATALALAVVFPEAGNLGGGGFAVVKMGDEVTSLDFRETAPAAASREMYLDDEGQLIPNASLVGPLAAGVPGSPAGLFALHQRHGVLPWPQVVEPARRLAADGFTVNRWLHELLAADAELLNRFAETREVWLPGGEPPAVGSVLRLPDLAATLGAYAEHGPEAISTGAVAEAIEQVSNRHSGILTVEDLAAYQPVWRQPVRSEAFGWQIAGMSLPSSGGVIVAQTTALLERLGWHRLPRFGADRHHLLIEVLRRSFADRFQLGDPDTTDALPQQLLAGPWLARRAAGIDRGGATPSTAVAPWPGEAPTEELLGDRLPAEPEDTTHLSVVDGDGNLVALTTTLNGLFGCGLYVPGAGFFLNNEMDDFAAQPGEPNLFGLVQGEANAVRPGRRMLSSMSPTIAWRGDEAVALGGRGGSKIPTNTVQVLLNLIVDGDELQEAVGRPRLHHQWLPDQVEAESDALAPETRAVLEERGHTFDINDRTAKVHAVGRRAGGTVEAAAEPRGSGAAGVVTPLEGESTLQRRRGVPGTSAPPPAPPQPSPPSDQPSATAPPPHRP